MTWSRKWHSREGRKDSESPTIGTSDSDSEDLLTPPPPLLRRLHQAPMSKKTALACAAARRRRPSKGDGAGLRRGASKTLLKKGFVKYAAARALPAGAIVSGPNSAVPQARVQLRQHLPADS
jgi:hypothetical protein